MHIIIHSVAWVVRGNFAFSCHEGYTKMPRPFSDDLRWKIICQRLFYAKRYKGPFIIHGMGGMGEIESGGT